MVNTSVFWKLKKNLLRLFYQEYHRETLPLYTWAESMEADFKASSIKRGIQKGQVSALNIFYLT